MVRISVGLANLETTIVRRQTNVPPSFVVNFAAIALMNVIAVLWRCQKTDGPVPLRVRYLGFSTKIEFVQICSAFNRVDAHSSFSIIDAELFLSFWFREIIGNAFPKKSKFSKARSENVCLVTLSDNAQMTAVHENETSYFSQQE